MRRLDARWLFSPEEPESFLAEHCERHHLHLCRGAGDYYRDLFTRAALERLLEPPGAVPFGAVYASIDGVIEYLPARQGGDEGTLEWVRHRLAGGKTLVVNGVSERCARVGALCRSLGEALAAPVHANAYLTPAGCSGHRVHFDTDDTIFLQIEGSKHWRLFAPSVALPLGTQMAQVQGESLGAPLAEIELCAGDLLYLPRGVVHVAVAGGEDSLHLTLGLHHRLWRDRFLQLAEAAAREDETLRRAVTWGPGGRPDSAALERALRVFIERITAPGRS